MDDLYYSLVEIATVIGVTKRAVHKRSKGWSGGRKRQARGGGMEYPLSALPPEWRESVRQHYQIEEAAPTSIYIEAQPDRPGEPQILNSHIQGFSHQSQNPSGIYSTGQVCPERVACLVTDVDVPGVPPHPDVLSRKFATGSDIELQAGSSPGQVGSDWVTDGSSAAPGFPHQVENPSGTCTTEQPSLLDETTQALIDAWIAVLRAQENWCAAHGIEKVVERDLKFADAWNAGTIEIDESVRTRLPRLSRTNLARQRSRLRQGNLAALAGKTYAPRSSKIDRLPQVREFVLGTIAQHPHITSRSLYQAVKTRFNQQGLDLPTEANLNRWIQSWKAENAELYMAISDPDKWKGQYMAAFGDASEGIIRPNQRWEFDSTPADVMLTDGRYALIGVVDVYTRRAKLLVSKTSKATAIAALARKALLDWGVPETAKTDNGKDYTSDHLTRCFAGLGIKHELCPPFQPWKKPHIERFFKTFSHDLVELLPGFIGHNVADRKAIESRRSFADRMMSRGKVVEVAMDAAALQAFCDQWIAAYSGRPHGGLNGQTPIQVLTQATGWQQRTIGNERLLDMLLAEAPAGGTRTVQKDNGIRIDNAWYIAPELAADGDDGYIKQRVHVRYDPCDLGRIYCFDGDGKFICVAECPERTGINRQEVASRAKKRQQKRISEGRKQMKRYARAAKTESIGQEILEAQAEQAGKVIPFRQPTIAHQTPALDAAAAALNALQRRPVQAPQLSEAEVRRIRDEMDAADARQQVEEPNDRISRIYRAWKSGQAIGPDDAAWADHYVRQAAGAGALNVLADSTAERQQFLNHINQGEAI